LARNPIDSDEGFAQAMRAAEKASGVPSDGELYGRPQLPTRPDQWNDYLDAYAGSQEIHPMYEKLRRVEPEKPRRSRGPGHMPGWPTR
jgi:hypothetical protein